MCIFPAASRKKPAKKKRDESRNASLSSKGSSDGHPATKLSGDGGRSRSPASATASSDEDEWNGQVDPRRGLSIDTTQRKPSSISKKPSQPKKVKAEVQQRCPSGSNMTGAKSAKKNAGKTVVRPDGEHGTNAHDNSKQTSEGRVCELCCSFTAGQQRWTAASKFHVIDRLSIAWLSDWLIGRLVEFCCLQCLNFGFLRFSRELSYYLDLRVVRFLALFYLFISAMGWHFAEAAAWVHFAQSTSPAAPSVTHEIRFKGIVGSHCFCSQKLTEISISAPQKLSKIGRKSSSHYLRRHSPRRSPSHDPDDEWPGFDWDNLRQCFGPKCRFAAAPGSKYCSDECGLALARKYVVKCPVDWLIDRWIDFLITRLIDWLIDWLIVRLLVCFPEYFRLMQALKSVLSSLLPQAFNGIYAGTIGADERCGLRR